MTQIEKNLRLFLDPAGRYADHRWRFVAGSPLLRSIYGPSAHEVVVLTFSRKELPHYLLAKVMGGRSGYRTREVLYVDDGILSSIFDASNLAAYRAFAGKHLPQPEGLRRRLGRLLPLWWRSERRFLVLLPSPLQQGEEREDRLLEENDFMFFSNAAGKLLLSRGDVFEHERGEIFKTTAEDGYVPVMEKEFATVAEIRSRLSAKSSLPLLGRCLDVRGRRFFTEQYIHGRSLCDVLDELAVTRDTARICSILDRLDQWYAGFQHDLAGTSAPLASLYGHLFPLFHQSFGERGLPLLQAGAQILLKVQEARPSVTAVTAHNDLWPGNFIVTADGLAVIDWERATQGRAPFFDYFWMVIAAAIQPLGRLPAGGHDYGMGFRRFVEGGEEISDHAHRLLRTFLARCGVPEWLLQHMLFLFLMEWSVQGFQILKRQTDMDRVAYSELQHFWRHCFDAVAGGIEETAGTGNPDSVRLQLGVLGLSVPEVAQQ